MKKYFAICIIVMFFLISCQPSEQSIQTAIAETQGSVTQVVEPTFTLTHAPSETPSPSPTPDTRVFDVDPKELLLEKKDLPIEGQYYLPNSNWIENLPNKVIIGSWTVEEGQEYIANTGRVHGWRNGFLRGTSNVLMPQEVYNNVVLFSSIEGAENARKFTIIQDKENGWKEIVSLFEIGDSIYFSEKENGNNISILVHFRYRNIIHFLTIYGTKDEVSDAFLKQICEVLIEKINVYPLTDSVTFSP